LWSQWYRCTIFTKTSWPLLISSAGKCPIIQTQWDCGGTEYCIVKSFPQLSEHREGSYVNVKSHSWMQPWAIPICLQSLQPLIILRYPPISLFFQVLTIQDLSLSKSFFACIYHLNHISSLQLAWFY
jgi:hypothetical protein